MIIICAIFQLTTDIILTIQIIYYRYINRKKSKDNNVISKDEESENSGTKDSNLLYKTINSDLANNLKI